MKYSAGLAIIYQNSILLSHPTNAKWFNSFSIPKGLIDGEESKLQTAIRETKEECGIVVPINLISSPSYTVVNKNRKTVYYFIVIIDSLKQIELKNTVIPKSNLQIEEIDWAGFLTKSQAKSKILPYQQPILEYL